MPSSVVAELEARMTLRFIEGFENSDSATHYQRKWAQFSLVGSTNQTGRLQGNSASPASGGISEWRTRSLGLQDSWVVGMGFSHPGSTVSDFTTVFPLIVKRGTSEQIRFQWRKGTGNTFKFDVFRGASLLGSTPDFVPLSWHYFEFKFTIATGTGGSIQVRHNAQNVLTLSGIDTADSGLAGADVFEIKQEANLFVLYDDFYILDDQGTINNDYLGDCVIEGRVPSGDGTVTQWDITNAFPHYQTLDDDVASDTDYIFSDTIGEQDLLTFNALSFITGQIHGVMLSSSARLDTTGTREYKHIIRSGGTTYTSPPGGTTHSVASTSYQVFYDVFEVDPDTSTKWTNLGVDSAEFGVEVVS